MKINLKNLKDLNVKMKELKGGKSLNMALENVKQSVSALRDKSKLLEGLPGRCSEMVNKISGLGAKKKTTVALDIGNYYVKMLEVSSQPGGTTLSRVSVAELPDPTSADDAKLTALIRKIVEDNNLPSKTVNISVSDPAVIVRYVFLPMMSKEELKGAIGYEAEKHIPFNVNEVVLGYQILERQKQEHRMRVLLVAVKRELIERRLRIVKEAGLDVGIVDVDAFAVINSFLSSNPELSTGAPAALINIGHKSTTINIIRDGLPFFTREIPVAGRDFTKAIARSMGLGTEEAGKMKNGISSGDQTRMLGAVQEVIGDLAREIQLSFSYYENEYGRKVEKIFLSGGTAKMPGLSSSLATRLEVEVECWDPLKTLVIGPDVKPEEAEKWKEILPVAIGLARRG